LVDGETVMREVVVEVPDECPAKLADVVVRE
jgi:hypothetical protein